MKDFSDKPTAVSDRALEMIMRDVLDGLYELSMESSLLAHAGDMEILEIRPEHPASQPKEEKPQAEVIDFPRLKRACG